MFNVFFFEDTSETQLTIEILNFIVRSQTLYVVKFQGEYFFPVGGTYFLGKIYSREYFCPRK